MVLGFYYYYYHYFKSTFISSPSCHHHPPNGLSTEGATWTCGSHLGFVSPWHEPSLKSYSWVLQICFWSWSSFQWKKDDCKLCHQLNTTVVIPNGERVQDVSEKLSVWQQRRHQNLGGSVLFIQVHVFYKSVMDRSTSEKPFVPGLIQMMVVISVSPTVSAICTPSNAADFFFFFFNFRGRRRSKKSAVLQLKCMDEVN